MIGLRLLCDIASKRDRFCPVRVQLTVRTIHGGRTGPIDVDGEPLTPTAFHCAQQCPVGPGRRPTKGKGPNYSSCRVSLQRHPWSLAEKFESLRCRVFCWTAAVLTQLLFPCQLDRFFPCVYPASPRKQEQSIGCISLSTKSTPTRPQQSLSLFVNHAAESRRSGASSGVDHHPDKSRRHPSVHHLSPATRRPFCVHELVEATP